MYRIKNQTRTGRFVRRLNRFVAEVMIDEQIVLTHVPNSGRMRELLIKGNRVILEEQTKTGRKTRYDLIMAEYEGFLVSIDSRLPNFLISDAISQGNLAGFQGYQVVKREVIFGESRLDMQLTGINDAFCEVKSVTLVKDGVAMFPDAPTSRGARHLRELIKAKHEGFEAFVIFLIQRDDAVTFMPNQETDPEFANTLAQALEAGVQAMAYTCKVRTETVEIIGQVSVQLPQKIKIIQKNVDKI